MIEPNSVIDYKIISSFDLTTLIIEVQNILDTCNGWEPLGAPFPYGGDMKQAIIKRAVS